MRGWDWGWGWDWKRFYFWDKIWKAVRGLKKPKFPLGQFVRAEVLGSVYSGRVRDIYRTSTVDFYSVEYRDEKRGTVARLIFQENNLTAENENGRTEK